MSRTAIASINVREDNRDFEFKILREWDHFEQWTFE